MFRKVRSLLIIMLMAISLSFLASCNNVTNESSSEYSNVVLSSESFSEYSNDVSKEEISSEEIKTYQKDEDGFYILEDDYFVKQAINDDKKISKLKYYDSYPSEYKYPQMKLFASDKEIPLFNCKTNFSQNWDPEANQRMNNSVAIIELEGSMEFKLQCNFAILNQCNIRPLAANITPIIDENRRVVTFNISSPGQYTIELRSNRTLHLFVNKYNEFEEYKNDSNVIYFPSGVHNKTNSKYINKYDLIELQSNTTIYLEMGAIVQAGFIASSKSNIKIVGDGIIDGSIFKRSATTNEKLIPFEFNFCNKILFDGVACTDPAGWCYNLYFCNDVTLKNIKIISSRSNGDGVSVQSCQNVICKDSFVRTWDDSLVVKNYPKWSNKAKQGTTKNILFENCLVWTDLAQSMEIGYETIGKIMEDITFRNITVLHNYHKAAISIHNANNADLKKIKFENITIEDAYMGKGDGNNILIDLSVAFSSTWSTNHATTGLGSVDGVIINNIKVIKANNPQIKIAGSYDDRKGYEGYHYLNNIEINDLQINGVIIDEFYDNLEIAYANNVKFSKSNNKVVGATISFDDSSEYGSNFEIICIK